ncbi:MAG: RDD family protein [Arcobacter sp.]|nr:MAG: RDD family protein [Arcobacter sp.]
MIEEINTEDYEYAGFWNRFWATMIDSILILMITIPISMTVYEDFLLNESIILGPADVFINYVLPCIAIIIFWLYKGATPGKMALNIIIVDATSGGKLSVAQSIGRYFAYIPATLPLFLGLFWVAWDKRKQGWHDKLANTVVIKKIKKEAVEFK